MGITKADKRSLADKLDAEGFIGITYSKPENRVIPTVILSNTDKSWLNRVQIKWGGKIGRSEKRTDKRRESWQWHIHGQKLLEVLAMVKPYLEIKKESAELCIELQRRIIRRAGRDRSGRLTREERRIRWKLYQKCRQLTKRGPRVQQLPFEMPEPQLSFLRELDN